MAPLAKGIFPKNYIGISEIAQLENIKKYKVKMVNACGQEALKKIEEVAPIAHLFKEFRKGSQKTYAILIKHYEYWKKTGEAPKKPPGRPRRWEGDITDIRIPAPYFYDQFREGVKKANELAIQQITIRDCIYLAMKEYMDRHPDIFYPELGDD